MDNCSQRVQVWQPSVLWVRKGQRGRYHTSCWCQPLGIGDLLPLAVLIPEMRKPSKQGCELVFMLALTDWESSLFYQI